jgi:glycosyltransferase involved in cell wall biosynthesis
MPALVEIEASKLRFVVAHRGSRLDFLLPRSVGRRFSLELFISDFYWPFNPEVMGGIGRFLPKLIRRGYHARHRELDAARICSFSSIGMRSWWALSWAASRNDTFRCFLRFDRLFAERVARFKMPPHDVFHCCAYASLEAMRVAKQQGIFVILYQFDPGKYEEDLVAEERKRCPGWEAEEDEVPSEYWERNREEWLLADLILTNSEWTRVALIRQGVPPEKMCSLPLSFEPDYPVFRKQHSEGHRRLRVLWLGSVIVRKGIHYLARAAQDLAGEPVDFTLAGPIGLTQTALNNCPPSMKFLGAVPRGVRSKLYTTHDVFVLPTLSDGFAITQLEALAHGMPVVVTPNCAQIVEDGVTGFLVPARDATAIAKALRRFLDEPALLDQMRNRCLEATAQYTVQAYADRLLQVVSERFPRHEGVRWQGS